MLQTDAYSFLSVAEVAEATDFFQAVHLARLLFESTYEQHLIMHLAQLFLRKKDAVMCDASTLLLLCRHIAPGKNIVFIPRE
jgi:hypothetical protein